MRLNVIVPINKKSFYRRLDELKQASIEEICGFIAGDEIKKYLKIELKNVTVKVIRPPGNRNRKNTNALPISIHIHSESRGFPLTCKCADIKQGLLECIKKLATLTPQEQQAASVMGITPIIGREIDDRPEQ